MKGDHIYSTIQNALNRVKKGHFDPIYEEDEANSSNDDNTSFQRINKIKSIFLNYNNRSLDVDILSRDFNGVISGDDAMNSFSSEKFGVLKQDQSKEYSVDNESDFIRSNDFNEPYKTKGDRYTKTNNCNVFQDGPLIQVNNETITKNTIATKIRSSCSKNQIKNNAISKLGIKNKGFFHGQRKCEKKANDESKALKKIQITRSTASLQNKSIDKLSLNPYLTKLAFHSKDNDKNTSHQITKPHSPYSCNYAPNFSISNIVKGLQKDCNNIEDKNTLKTKKRLFLNLDALNYRKNSLSKKAADEEKNTGD